MNRVWGVLGVVRDRISLLGCPCLKRGSDNGSLVFGDFGDKMRLFGETIALFFGEKLAPILLERLDAQIRAARCAFLPAGHGCGRVADSIIVIINIINIITIIGASANYSLPHSLLPVLTSTADHQLLALFTPYRW